MKIFSIDSELYEVTWEPQVLLLEPFAKLFRRDKTKGKIRANKELAFVWFYADIRSDYHIHDTEEKKVGVIKADLKLPISWKMDKVMKDAIEFYKKCSTSISAVILEDSIYVAHKASKKMREAVDRDNIELREVKSILDSLKSMPEVIRSLKAAESEVIKEIEVAQDNIGSKEKALFEDGQLHVKR